MSSDARVHDIRYRRDDGDRLGLRRATWSLARWNALRALGVGRDWRAKAGPLALLLAAFSPALVVLGVRALLSERFGRDLPTDLIPYGEYARLVDIVVFVFAALVGPRLMCEDRADRVLPLYFATAVSRSQYVVGKLLAAFLPMLLITTAPVLTMYAGNVVFDEHPLSFLRDSAADVPRIVAGGVLIALFYACIATAISSLTARQAPAIGGYAALMLGSGVLSILVGEAYQGDGVAEAVALITVPATVYEHLFPASEIGVSSPALGPSLLTYVLVVCASLATLVLRYRRADQ